MSNLSESVKEKVNDKELSRQVAVINSMTNQERKFPDIIKGNRKKRIAAGCGQDVQDLNKLLKQFKMMQKMMKRFKKGNMANMMRGLQSNMGGMGGGLGR
jgi:signal recognition particle subunit SRP54